MTNIQNKQNNLSFQDDIQKQNIQEHKTFTS